ncbi:DUF3025 domain-containing protein [Ramlibacter sp. Leaf400]|uniref:DUF3025 domain-containing protein n=1 Tax=Ramlibacter sp. Leaf400 TaxID=1736365 RepID=UPI0006FCED16|nr:DUF3025 domain-containing protein [Ramlibacter sp. Leaf400]KQT08950.1 hypothetical protein ASG30_15850 [Ramlibacter sp. Leaf400]
MTERLDWEAPWYAPWREPGQAVEQLVAAASPLHETLNAQAPSPVRFVAQDALPEGMPYEQFIFERRECPTRDNLHDFFNGLVWHRLPRSKARLNALQAGEIAAHGIGGRRGPVRDAITLFDENGALLDAPPPVWDALLARNWKRLFIDLRPRWQEARVVVFGHALLEKLAAPRKDLTAHVWHETCPLPEFEAADTWLAQRCTPQRLAGKPFTPLPLAGIPGWDAGNLNFSFYDDSVVFRPRRR